MWLVVVEFGKSVAHGCPANEFDLASFQRHFPWNSTPDADQKNSARNRNLVFNTFSFYVIDIIDTAFSSFRGFLIAKIVELWNGLRNLMRFWWWKIEIEQKKNSFLLLRDFFNGFIQFEFNQRQFFFNIQYY